MGIEKGLVVVIGGTSGAGKATVMWKLLGMYPDMFEHIVSTTSRTPRAGEVEGIHYNFVTEDAFKKLLDGGILAEYTYRHGNYYGISKDNINRILEKGKIPIVDADYKAVVGLKEHGYNVASFYLLVDKEMVALRLKFRDDDDEMVAYRLSDFDNHFATRVHYDYHVPNVDLLTCSAEIMAIIKKRMPKMRPVKQKVSKDCYCKD